MVIPPLITRILSSRALRSSMAPGLTAAILFVHILLPIQQVSSATIECLLQDAGGNTTALKHDIAPPWADSPSYRGTASILWSCIVTLTACVYTAIHLNIPMSHRSKWRQLGAKTKWVIAGLLGPELVLMSAAKQFRAATRLCKALNSLTDVNRSERQAFDEMPSKVCKMNQTPDRYPLT